MQTCPLWTARPNSKLVTRPCNETRPSNNLLVTRPSSKSATYNISTTKLLFFLSDLQEEFFWTTINFGKHGRSTLMHTSLLLLTSLSTNKTHRMNAGLTGLYLQRKHSETALVGIVNRVRHTYTWMWFSTTLIVWHSNDLAVWIVHNWIFQHLILIHIPRMSFFPHSPFSKSSATDDSICFRLDKASAVEWNFFHCY